VGKENFNKNVKNYKKTSRPISATSAFKADSSPIRKKSIAPKMYHIGEEQV
jgi:hypothetical protein